MAHAKTIGFTFQSDFSLATLRLGSERSLLLQQPVDGEGLGISGVCVYVVFGVRRRPRGHYCFADASRMSMHLGEFGEERKLSLVCTEEKICKDFSPVAIGDRG